MPRPGTATPTSTTARSSHRLRQGRPRRQRGRRQRGRRHPQGLPRSCADGGDCYRYIVVADPDGASSLDQWNRAVRFFDGYNGPGQGGPGSDRGNPYSANRTRYGTDAGQPGDTAAFTTEVTPDGARLRLGELGVDVDLGSLGMHVDMGTLSVEHGEPVEGPGPCDR